MSDTLPTRSRVRVASYARHGRLTPRTAWRSVLAFVAAALAVVLVSVVVVAGIAVYSFASGFKTVDIGEANAPPPAIGAYPGGFNVLIVGTDNSPTQGNEYGGKRDATLNDVNILLHVSADHTRAVAITIPRDTVVPIPSCTDPDTGRTHSAMSGQPINNAFQYGGLACVHDTVEDLTGLTIQFAGLITFDGVVAMSNAVGGVPVCTTGPIVDPQSGLDLPTGGTHVLSGQQALAFLRTRHGVGDGSDLGRVASQQVFLASLVRTLRSADTLGNPKKVVQLAYAARDNMTLSSSLANIDTMISMAQALKDIPLDSVVFVQYPTVGYPAGSALASKVRPDTEAATQLMALVKADQPFALGDQSGREGAVEDPNAASPSQSPSPTSPSETPAPGQSTPAPAPTVDAYGQTAAQQTCSQAASTRR